MVRSSSCSYFATTITYFASSVLMCARRESADNGFTASDRRVLMTQWVSAAYAKVCAKYDSLRRYFVETGALMTTNGVGDDLICPVTLPEGIDRYTFEDPVKDAEERAEGVAACAARLRGGEAKEEPGEQKADLVDPAAGKGAGDDDDDDDGEVVSQFELSDEEGLGDGDAGGAPDTCLVSWRDGIWLKGFEPGVSFAVPSARAIVKNTIAFFEEDCGWIVALVARKAHGSDAHQYLINFAADDEQVRDLLPILHFIVPAASEPE